jgi:hypothetical protein
MGSARKHSSNMSSRRRNTNQAPVPVAPCPWCAAGGREGQPSRTTSRAGAGRVPGPSAGRLPLPLRLRLRLRLRLHLLPQATATPHRGYRRAQAAVTSFRRSSGRGASPAPDARRASPLRRARATAREHHGSSTSSTSSRSTSSRSTSSRSTSSRSTSTSTSTSSGSSGNSTSRPVGVRTGR